MTMPTILNATVQGYRGAVLASGRVMANSNRNRKNQPPTRVGKKQPRRTAPKADKRSVVAQAAPNRAELNYASADEESPRRSEVRHKAGR
jgi:hypothetical protein